MLKITNAQKYFHKGRKNQIHVINNTSLSLEDKGLVALLGPSGCGKTTLLNTIGGLDKIKSGSIYVNGKKISTRFSSSVDKIRALDIGYIFQDYKLIDNLSVYDNVALVLKMLGEKDKEVIKTKVEYVLNKVGMLRYKKRPASMLSGGERQRVGIARAIVKNPAIILADEPTGNLDSKNTLEVMKIIKAISKERLVILVTHEQDLANFYATRIIKIEDGTVLEDFENTKDNDLDYKQDNTFYLKDFNHQLNLTKNNIKDNEDTKDIDIKVFSDQDVELKLAIVLKNGNIYIQSKTPTKIEVVDENSRIDFIDANYQKIAKKEALKYHFDFSKLAFTKRKYTSIFNPLQLIINGFKKVFAYPILKKILLIGLFLSGIFIMYSISSIAAALNIEEEDFIEVTPNYLVVTTATNDISKYLEYEQLANVDYVLPGNSKITLTVPFDWYYQTRNYSGDIDASLTSLEQLTPEDLIQGRLPENDYEIVLDKMAITRAFDNNDSFQMLGLTQIEDLLEKDVTFKYMNNFKIVGITDIGSPSVYVNKNMLLNILNSNANNQNNYYDYYEGSETSDTTLLDYHLYDKKISLTKGRLPENDYEVIVPQDNASSMPLNKEMTTKVNEKKLLVVGYYDSQENYSYYLVNSNTIKYQLISKEKNITISTSDKASLLKTLIENKVNVKDSYAESKNNYIKQKKEEIKTTLIVSGIILIISLVEIFLMMRSSFLSRIKEIGIYRAIGLKKLDIYKMFTGEIIAITTLAGIPGLVLMAYILSILAQVKYVTNYIMINSSLIFLACLFIYLFNLLIGLIPVYNTIRKRPAEILARYDLD